MPSNISPLGCESRPTSTAVVDSTTPPWCSASHSPRAPWAPRAWRSARPWAGGIIFSWMRRSTGLCCVGRASAWTAPAGHPFCLCQEW